jgi:hypothetical protein
MAPASIFSLLILGLCLGGPGCSSSASTPHDAASGSAGAGGPDAGGDATADAAAWTCQQVRICASTCTSDSCVSDCKQRGSATALAAFQTVTSCTQGSAADGGGGCPPIGDPGYYNCLCLAQCLQDPPCAATLDPCLGTVSIDLVCVACN